MKKEKKKLFKSKEQMIIYIILYIICIGLFIIIGKNNYKKENVKENIKFSNLYNLVDENNLYVFSNANDILEIINGRSGVILFAFPSNKYSNNYAYLLNKAGQSVGLDKIYYYNFLKDRDENNGTYETIVNKLSNYLKINDEGIKDIYAPSILIVKDGSILYYIDDLTFTNNKLSVEEYFNINSNNIYNNFYNYLYEYVSR